MTPFPLSDQPNQQNAGGLSTLALVQYAVDNGPGLDNVNYVNAYNAIYNNLIEEIAAGNAIAVNVLSWFQQAPLVNQEGSHPTAQGTFIWDYMAAAAFTERSVTLTTQNIQNASNTIANTVFTTLLQN